MKNFFAMIEDLMVVSAFAEEGIYEPTLLQTDESHSQAAVEVPVA